MSHHDFTHVDGNLYYVPLSAIDYSDNPNKSFSNPRHTLVAGRPEAAGLNSVALGALKESIRRTGLQHPPILRVHGKPGEGRAESVSGERRVRCIRMLVKENADCYDPNTQAFVPAAKLYARIQARLLIDVDDEKAYEVAWQVNGDAVDIGEGAAVSLVRRWRQLKWSDEKILKITNKSTTWLRDTDVLCGLDDMTFEAMANGEINRAVAIKLAGVKDTAERQVELNEIQAVAAKRLKGLIEKCNKSLEDAVSEREVAEADLRLAEELGDKNRLRSAKKRVDKAGKTIDKRVTEHEELHVKRPTATGKDMDRHRAANGGRKLLSYSKVERHWLPMLDRLIKHDGVADDEGKVCSVEHARFLLHVLKTGVGGGEADVCKVIRSFTFKNR